MLVILTFITAVLSWSLYPVIAVFGLKDVDPIAYLFWMQLAATITSGWIFLMAFSQNRTRFADLWAYAKTREFMDYVYLLGCGLISALFHLCFLFALEMTSEIVAAVIFEAWPIIAVFLTGFIVQKQWEALNWKHFALGFLSLLGAVKLTLSKYDVNLVNMFQAWETLKPEMDFMYLMGAILAYMAALMMALSTLMRSQIANAMEKALPDLKNSLSSSMFAVFITRIFTLPVTFWLYLELAGPSNYTAQSVTTIIAAGALVYAISAAAYTIATLRAKSPSIHIYWFILPVLTVFWLEIFGVASLTADMIPGIAIIVFCNLALGVMNFRQSQKDKAETPRL